MTPGWWLSAVFATALAQGANAPDVQIGHWAVDGDPRRGTGLNTLAWALRERTSVAADPRVRSVDIGRRPMNLFDAPLVVVHGSRQIPSLSAGSKAVLADYLRGGGLVWFDLSNGDPHGAFRKSVAQLLASVIPSAPLEQLSTEHVLYKTFYLLKHHGGRIASRAFIEAAMLDDRIVALVTANDVLGAMARDDYGEWTFDPGPLGERARETSIRLGINIAMYALCLDYKADQVHLPFILKRRQ